ncbi:MAG: DUF3226 domain-containing protein [Methanobacterium sp.]
MMPMMQCTKTPQKPVRKIKSEKILIVEGADECHFFAVLLEHIGITGIEIYDMGGKDQFNTNMDAFVDTRGFDNVHTIGIVRDADDHCNGAFRSVCDCLTNLDDFNCTVPSEIEEFSSGDPTIGIYIMPGSLHNGMLEDLVLSTVISHPIMPHVDNFLNESMKLNPCPKNPSKAKNQIFLASMEEIVCSVGLGARKHYWNLDDSNLSDLKYFLEKFR